VRHTRADEELGRHEVLRSLPVRRHTSAVAALLGAVALNAVISLVSALALLAVGIEGLTAAGAFVYALAMGVAGLFFAAAALLLCQLFSSSRGAIGASFALLGVLFILRAVGDMQDGESVLSLVSPLGLGLRVFAFYENNPIPLVYILLETAALAAAAVFISGRRALGEGLIAARKGRAQASPLLLSPLGLAWRLQRGSFLGWMLAMLAFGGMYGAVLGQMDNFLSQIDMFRQMVESMGGDDLVQSFISMLLLITGLLAAVPVIGCVNRLRGEEKQGRLEQIYARAVPRGKMMLSFLLLAALAGIVMPLCGAVGMYAVGGASMDLGFGALCGAALAYVPALWCMAGLCALLAGCFPKTTALVWAVFGWSFFVNYIGKAALPESFASAAANVTPFGSTPQLPVQEFSLTPLLILTAAGLALCAAGLYGYRGRDVG